MMRLDDENSIEKVPGREVKAAKHAANGTVVGFDGLRVCAKCGMPVEMDIGFGGKRLVVPTECACDAAERYEREQLEEQRAFEERQRRRPGAALSLPVPIGCSFEESDPVKGLRMAQAYGKRFGEMRDAGMGLTLIGEPGTGKTHAIYCLANLLRSQRMSVLVTSIARCESVFWDTKGCERVKVLDDVGRYDLLVIDDLGAERDTSYMDDQAFRLIDARYASGLPMVVTTNIEYRELSNPQGLAKKRIYERILERCQPVVFDNPSFREAMSRKTRLLMESLLGDVG